MEGFFVCKGRTYLCCGRIFIQMLLNQLWVWTENSLSLQKTEARRDIKEPVQGVGHWAKCLLLSLGSRECHCPLGIGGHWEGEIWVEKIMQGRRQGSDTTGKGRRKDRGSWSLRTPTPTQGRLSNCGEEIIGTPEILEPFFQKVILSPK